MKLHVLTDVHLEFQKWRRAWDIASVDCDVHVLAGDIGNGFTGLDFALMKFTKPVIYVCGNHEFYCQRPIQDWWRKAREKVAGSQVHLLENESAVIGGTRFLGATLWTDYCLFGDDRQEEHGKLAEKESNDFSQIYLTRRGAIHFEAVDPYAFGFTRKRSGDRLTWKKVAEMHQRSREFLETEQNKPFDGKTILVTHHAPSINGIEQPDMPCDLDAAYASNLDHLVAKADLWIHGHVHRACTYQGKFGGRVVENARGYKDSGLGSVPGFKWDLVVDTNQPKPERSTSCKP